MNRFKYHFQYILHHTKQSLLTFWLDIFQYSSLLIYRENVVHPTHLSFITALVELCDKLDIRLHDTTLWFKYWQYVSYDVPNYDMHKEMHNLIHDKYVYHSIMSELHNHCDLKNVDHSVITEVYNWIFKEFGEHPMRYNNGPNHAYDHGFTADQLLFKLKS